MDTKTTSTIPLTFEDWARQDGWAEDSITGRDFGLESSRGELKEIFAAGEAAGRAKLALAAALGQKLLDIGITSLPEIPPNANVLFAVRGDAVDHEQVKQMKMVVDAIQGGEPVLVLKGQDGRHTVRLASLVLDGFLPKADGTDRVESITLTRADVGLPPLDAEPAPGPGPSSTAVDDQGAPEVQP